jgi:thioredoxin reductase
LDGLFISIGRNPETGLFKDQLLLDDKGYILADETTQTSLPGVFAVGDVRTKQVRQIVTACGDGAVAAQMAEQMLTLQMVIGLLSRALLSTERPTLTLLAFLGLLLQLR